MHSALVVVKRPILNPAIGKNEPEKKQWLDFVSRTQEVLKKNQTIESFGDTTWQVALENGLSALTELLQVLNGFPYEYRVLFFAVDPPWVVTPSKPDV